MEQKRWEYATVEWIWDQGSLRLNLPDGNEIKQMGSYPEVVTFLSDMGRDGWEVATCVAVNNWLYWTLKRPQ